MRKPSATPTSAAGAAPRGFPRTSRILRPAEFRATYDQGFRISGPLFAAFCRARPQTERSAEFSGPRLGLTVPRAIGPAVVRNRIKRRLREVFRLHRSEIGPQWDIVVNPRRAVLDARFPDIEKAFGRLIEKCGP